jgi:MFS family permease
VCALAPSLQLTISGRALQGLGSGVFPLSFGIVRDEFPAARVPTAIGLMGAVAGIGGGIGLPLGGVIADHADFHWIFWLSVVVGAAATATTILFVPESPVRKPGRVDVPGALLLAVGLIALLLAISKANAWGWAAPRTLGLLAAGGAVLVGWVFFERRRPMPLVDMRTLGRRAVLTTNVATLLVGFGLFASFILLPQLAEEPHSTGYGFGLNATQAGLLLMPMALSNLLIAPLGGAIGARRGSRVPLVAGSAIASVGLLLLALDHSTPAAVVVWAILLGTGIGLAFAAMPNLIIEAVEPHETGEATGVNTIMRNIGATIGAQLAASVLAAHVISGTSLPADRGFTLALLIGAGGGLVAALCGLAIPSRTEMRASSAARAALAADRAA